MTKINKYSSVHLYSVYMRTTTTPTQTTHLSFYVINNLPQYRCKCMYLLHIYENIHFKIFEYIFSTVIYYMCELSTYLRSFKVSFMVI